MEDKLDLILQKLDTLDELKEIVLALRDRQEETDANLESLTMDVHKIHGNVKAIQEQLTNPKGSRIYLSPNGQKRNGIIQIKT